MQITAPVHFLLVPGFWLGAWAWDRVTPLLEAAGHKVTALSLPGLASEDEDRSAISLEDHISAITEAIRTADGPIVLVLHSGAGFSGYAAADRLTGRIRHIIYVDSGPGNGQPMNPEFTGDEYPMPDWEAMEQEGNSLDGLDEATLDMFRERALPQPGRILREGFELTNPARRDVPSTIICTSVPSSQLKEWAEQGAPFIAEAIALTGPVTWTDMPTGHWPMWSEPQKLAGEMLKVVAQQSGDRE